MTNSPVIISNTLLSLLGVFAVLKMSALRSFLPSMPMPIMIRSTIAAASIFSMFTMVFFDRLLLFIGYVSSTAVFTVVIYPSKVFFCV